MKAGRPDSALRGGPHRVGPKGKAGEGVFRVVRVGTYRISCWSWGKTSKQRGKKKKMNKILEDSPELPVHNVGRALDFCPAVAGAPGVDYELDVPAPELALRHVSGRALGKVGDGLRPVIPRCIRTCQASRT